MKPEAAPPDRLKRLIYRSIHRGCKETDLIFAQFANSRLSQLEGATLDTYENLLEEADADIWQWLVSGGEPAEYASLIAMLAEYSPKSD